MIRFTLVLTRLDQEKSLMNIAGKGVLLIIAVITEESLFSTKDLIKITQLPQCQFQALKNLKKLRNKTKKLRRNYHSIRSSSEENNGGEVNEGSQPTSTSVLHPPAEVRVLVANGTDVTGAAGATLDTL